MVDDLINYLLHWAVWAPVIVVALIASVQSKDITPRDFIISIGYGAIWPLTVSLVIFIVISSLLQRLIVEFNVRREQRRIRDSQDEGLEKKAARLWKNYLVQFDAEAQIKILHELNQKTTKLKVGLGGIPARHGQ